MLAFVVFLLRLGWGLWRLENAARIGMALLILLTVLGHLGVEVLLFLARHSTTAVMSATEGGLYFGLLGLYLVIVIYLFLPSTRRAFQKTS